ncbi:hypothetical protein [Archangium violaceum]|uniref:hypothetical protein n=1 Tax=Archangium violaceum TaxID=83451 RepID=UPI0036D97F43
MGLGRSSKLGSGSFKLPTTSPSNSTRNLPPPAKRQRTSSPAPTPSGSNNPPRSSTSAPGTAAPTTPPRVQARIDDRQKIHLASQDTPATRLQHRNDYFSMDGGDFVTLKNGGKRTGSNKMTDPLTGKNYTYDKQTQQFYEFDKTRPGNKGNPIDPQNNAALKQQLDTHQLLDRSRADRNSTKNPLLPGDVGPYKKNLLVDPNNPKSELVRVNDAKADFNSNRDHVPSGESLKRRNAGGPAQQVYDQGVTVAIPDDKLHKSHSLTYGTRQKADDIVGQSPTPGQTPPTMKRVDYDAANPSSAFHRDSTHLLDNTYQRDLFNHGKDNTALQQRLDMNGADSRLNLIGAYRYAGNLNTKLNANYPNENRGYNPQDAAQTARIHGTTPGGSKNGPIYDKHQFAYTPTTTPGQTQGQVISNSFRDRLVNEGFAQNVPDISGSGTKRPLEE